LSVLHGLIQFKTASLQGTQVES